MMDFTTISLTGRLCYLFMCIEKYLVTCYPDRDWTPVAERCWSWTEGYWDEGVDRYDCVVPAFILEFPDYEKTNKYAFDGTLSEEDYRLLTNLYAGITDGKSDQEIDDVLHMPVDFHNACEGSGFSYADGPTQQIVNDMLMILQKHGIAFPDIERVRFMSADIKNGWGDFIESEYLSIILNETGESNEKRK